MIAAETLGAINFWRPANRHYGWFSAAQVIADTVVMCALVAGLHNYVETTTWTGLIIPIVAGSLRFKLPGALLAWAATSAFLPLVLSRGERPPAPGDLVFAVIIHLMVAFISGTQSGAFGRRVAELDQAKDALKHQASHDPLTGLPNRNRLAEFADSKIGHQLTCLLLDLNGFKQINDSLGHAAGDEVLRQTAYRIRACIGAEDLAGRLGGDEFQVLLPHATPGGADDLICRLREEINSPIRVGDNFVTVGVAIGSAYRPSGDEASLDALTYIADQAMYQEKRRSRKSAQGQPSPYDGERTISTEIGFPHEAA
ncbi:GGDEF domain-containing protein [Actinoplanes couchii]|nr:GGDEF domain-containing protein [Actinoplanes couchii]MDR6324104.1 diguanylate cyclase (GGDEF)-like protein [Actinoplanes couchii]